MEATVARSEGCRRSRGEEAADAADTSIGSSAAMLWLASSVRDVEVAARTASSQVRSE